jgi:CBS domain-containing protein
MTTKPATVSAEHLAVEALKIIEDRRINSIVVVSPSGQVAGFVDVQDLPRFKLM